MPFVMGYRGQPMWPEHFVDQVLQVAPKFPIELCDWEIESVRSRYPGVATWDQMTAEEKRETARQVLVTRSDAASRAQLDALNLNLPLANTFSVLLTSHGLVGRTI